MRKKATKATGAESGSAPDAALLLAWYDRHRRILPWRARPGEAADPYRVWLSEIMLQQTTVKAVAPYFLKFLQQWPTVADLAAAPREDVLRAWAGLGYYARARNLHACAQVVATLRGGEFPRSRDALLELPGIGPYTASAIVAIAYDGPAVPVDGNIERVVSRLHAIETELPQAKPEIARRAEAMRPASRSGDFAQALMDLGSAICTPKKPACSLCPWAAACIAHARGDAETFPRKPERQTGALRRGAAFVVTSADGKILLRDRPSTGLLGGMTEVPGSDWSADFDVDNALAEAPRLGGPAAWRKMPGVVRHVFTHFPLELTVFRAAVDAGARVPDGMRWVGLEKAGGEALPNVIRKVLSHAFEDAQNSSKPKTAGRAATEALAAARRLDKQPQKQKAEKRRSRKTHAGKRNGKKASAKKANTKKIVAKGRVGAKRTGKRVGR